MFRISKSRNVIKFLEYKFQSLRKRGQIDKQSNIGRWIELISSLDEVTTIVEIGTWNGLGSSKLIARGVLSNKNRRKSVNVIGVEVSLEMKNLANKHLKKYSFYKLVWGHIVAAEQLDGSHLTSEESGWFESDLKNLLNSPNVLSQLPEEIDMLVLDGGEFSSFAEFKTLESRLKGWIVLDDTDTRKCKRVYDELQNSNSFNLIFSSDERHGTAIFKIKPKSL